MKKIITITFLALVVNLCKANLPIVKRVVNNSASKIKLTSFNSPYGEQDFRPFESIRVIFQNNSGKKGILKFKLSIENPDGTKRVEELAISGDESIRKELNVEIGAKIFLENGYKLNTLVGGKAPPKNEPFMIVMARDKNQTINLVEEINATEVLVLANAAKAAEKLKLTSNAKIDYVVTGNIVTVSYSSEGKIIAEFDCDKKNGNIKNISDLRKKSK